MTIGSFPFGTPTIGGGTGKAAEPNLIVPAGLVVSQPQLGTPQFIGNPVTFRPANLVVSSPQIGVPVFSKHVAIIPGRATAGYPVLGPAYLRQRHLLTTTSLSAGSPVIGQPLARTAASPIGITVSPPVLAAPALVLHRRFQAVQQVPAFTKEIIYKGWLNVTQSQSVPAPTQNFTVVDPDRRHLSASQVVVVTTEASFSTIHFLTVSQNVPPPINDILFERSHSALAAAQTVPAPTQIATFYNYWTVHEEGYGAQLIYPQATGLEKAMADADAERLIAINAEAIKSVWDPWEIPYKYLPYLAWAMGVGYWDDDWSELTKRDWTARAWHFKALRGTQRAQEIAIDYAGRDVSPFGYRVRGAITPPQRIFSGPSLTAAQKESWLQNLPQIRVWRINERGTADKFKAFLGGHHSLLRQHNYRFCLYGTISPNSPIVAPTPSTAINRLKRRARWVVGGVETETTISEFGSYWRVHLPGEMDKRVFTKRCFGLESYYQPSTAQQRLVTVQPTPTLAHRIPVGPTLEPVYAEPERIVVNGERDHSVFCDVPCHYKAFYVPTSAPLRIYQRYAVVGSGAPQVTNPHVQYMGTGYYGWPKYTAWVSVSLSNKRCRWAAGEGIMWPNLRFWIPHDQRPLQRGRAAARSARAMRDRILLDLGEVHRWTAEGRPFLAETDQLIVGRPPG